MTSREQDKARWVAIGDSLPIPTEIRDDFTHFGLDMITDLWRRPGLTPAQRSLVTISALVALNRPAELSIHIGKAIGNGVSRAEICEAIMHLAAYAGYPAALGGMHVAHDTFGELDARE